MPFLKESVDENAKNINIFLVLMVNKITVSSIVSCLLFSLISEMNDTSAIFQQKEGITNLRIY